MTFSDSSLLQYIYLKLANKLYNNPRYRIDRLLVKAGGDDNQIDGVGTYVLGPAAGEVMVLTRMNVYIEDGTNEKFSADKYGATAALATGILVRVDNATDIVKTLTPKPITKIGHWNLAAGVDMVWTDFPTGGSDFASVRWSFTKGGGAICLIGDKGEFISAVIQDDLGAGGAALVAHYISVQGFVFRPPRWWKESY